jgi:hypothetical protein
MKKKKGPKRETGFDKLARLIKSESDDIRSTMATKEATATKAEMNAGFASIRNEMTSGFAGIRAELADIKQRLKALEVAVGNHSGFSREIDHAFERIAAIEKHLSLKQKARA